MTIPRFRRIFLLIAASLALGPALLAQTYYVRQGASGNGSDWANAYGALPATLVRGATYYVADGSYSGYTFDDAESGSTRITIKKATLTDHGTSSGWSDAYGDGQAVFSGSFRFKTGYYTIDGQKRNESNWKDDASYGFRLKSAETNTSQGENGNYITIQYASVGGNYSETYYSGMSTAIYCAYNIRNWTISRCFLHNSTRTIVQFAGVNSMVIEYSFIGPGWGKEAIRGQVNCYNVTIRHNIFYDSTQRDPQDSTSGITAEIGIWDGSNFNNVEIYGNTFTNSKSGGRNAVIVVGGNGSSWAGPGTTGTKVNNNTFAGIADNAVFGSVVVNGSGNEARNNLFYNSANTSVSASTRSNNVVASSNPFVNLGGLDLRLTSDNPARNAGVAIGGSPYNEDRFGTVRGADGAWDVGAYEFASGTTTNTPPSITSHPVSVTSLLGLNVSFSVSASGTAPFTYQWQRNGVNISGATGSTYSLLAALLDNGATYRVVVSNAVGSVTSNGATLTVTSTPTNNPPTVSLTSPASGTSFTAPATLSLAANAADSDGSIARVEFYQGSTRLGEDTTSPYTYSWTGVAAGTYSITARATDNAGATTTSSAVSVTVSAAGGGGDTITVGGRVVVVSDPTLRVRSSAALAGTVVGDQNVNATGTVVSGPIVADGYTWWQIDYDSGVDGWSIQGSGSTAWLAPAPTAVPPAPSGLGLQ